MQEAAQNDNDPSTLMGLAGAGVTARNSEKEQNQEQAKTQLKEGLKQYYYTGRVGVKPNIPVVVINKYRLIKEETILHKAAQWIKDNPLEAIELGLLQQTLICEGSETLLIDNVTVGPGSSKVLAEIIEKFANFLSSGEELRVNADNATIGSFLMPKGKVYFEVGYCLDFKADGNGQFQGIDLYLDLTKNIDDKKIELPDGTIKFDKISIKGAKVLKIPGTVIAEAVELVNCATVQLNKTRIGHLKYENDEKHTGQIVFGEQTNSYANINSFWLIGRNSAIFRAQAEVFDLDSEGKCYLSIYNSYKGNIIKLNLNLDPNKDTLDATKGEFIGLSIHNYDNKLIIIDKILAKLNTFNVIGAVSLGNVICQPFDPKYNIVDIQIDVKNLNNFHIGSFFAGFDHDIVLDTETGRISLKQSVDRALTGGKMFATFTCALQQFLTIRAGQGLSFKGNIEVIDGDIDLFTLFGKLSLRGSLKAKNQIRLAANEGIIDLSAELDAKSVITYAKTDQYTHDTVINAKELLAHVVGRYLQHDTQINANEISIISENKDILLQASRMQANNLFTKAQEQIVVEHTTTRSAKQQYIGGQVQLTASDIVGNTSIDSKQGIRIDNSKMSGTLSHIAAGSIGITDSNLSGNVDNQGGGDLYIAGSEVHGSMQSELKEDFISANSYIVGSKIETNARGKIVINDSVIAGKVVNNNSYSSIEIKNSNILANNMVNQSSYNITIDDSQILSNNSLFFKAVSNYLAVNSNITISQSPYKLFVHSFGAKDREGNPILRCGLSIKETEVLGVIGTSGYSSANLQNLQCNLVNSARDLALMSEVASTNPRGIFIDAYSGVIMGSQLQAKGHQVIIKTNDSLELLPLAVYNSAMLGGGLNDEGVKYTISKIEAGLIDIDAGGLLQTVGALLRASKGSIKAEEWINEDASQEIIDKQQAFRELTPWLKSPAAYDLIINKQVVPTKLEFREITKIDLGESPIDIFFPYQSKKVYLTQRSGDVHIDRDVDFSKHELMAINASSGQIFFGIPKTERQTTILSYWFGAAGDYVVDTTEHVNVAAQSLYLTGEAGIELHADINATGTVQLKSDNKITINADSYNLGKEIKQSVIRSDNTYIIASDIEIKGSLITAKNNLQLVSHNDIKILPIELLSHYHHYYGHTKEKGMALKQVVSELNAGHLSVDAGRAAEFISTLIEAENLSIKAQDLKIGAAKDIFEQQIEQKSKKWFGLVSDKTQSYKRDETVVSTVIRAKNQQILVDHDATIEAAKIFAEQNILLKVGNNLTIKDGYNLHVHDYQSHKYSLLSFEDGGLKIHSNKSVKDCYHKHDSVPTLIQAGGVFHGIVDGKMHVLGSKIIGKDIHLVVPQGVKLEASKYIDTSVNFVHESGMRLGFYKNTQGSDNNSGGYVGEIGLTAGMGYTTETTDTRNTHLARPEIIASDTFSVIAKDGVFEQISANLAAKIIHVEARDWIAKTYDEETITKHFKEHVDVGVKLALKQRVTKVTEKIGQLVNKSGSHVIDHTDRAFKAYDAYKSLALLPDNAFSGGLYAYLDSSTQSSTIKQVVAVDNTINGEQIRAHIDNDIRFNGVKMTGRDVTIEACNFDWQTSSDKYEYHYDLGHIDLEANLMSKILDPRLDSTVKSVEKEALTHHENYIRASGTLKLKVSGTGKLQGCSLEGIRVEVDAKNLITETVQDKISERLAGANLHLGFNDLNIPSIGGGIEYGQRNAAWSTQVAKIVGSQVLNVTVKETLDIAGGMLVSAETDKDGKLTKAGELSVNCGRLIVKTLHDYDEGVSLGIGASFQVAEDKNYASSKGKDFTFEHGNLKVEYHNKEREVRSTIGEGQVKATVIEGDNLARDLKQQVELTVSEQWGFDNTIHRSMFGAEREKPLSVTKILRTEAGEDKVVDKISHYVMDVADNFTTACREMLKGGAQVINLLGSNIDQQKLDEQVQALLGRDAHTGLLKSEQERLSAKIAKLQAAAEADSQISGLERLAYEEFISQLERQIANASNNKEVSILKAAKDIYKARYAKELKAAQEEGRELRELGSFILDVQSNQLAKAPSFAQVQANIVAAYITSQQLLKQAQPPAETQTKDAHAPSLQKASQPQTPLPEEEHKEPEAEGDADGEDYTITAAILEPYLELVSEEIDEQLDIITVPDENPEYAQPRKSLLSRVADIFRSIADKYESYAEKYPRVMGVIKKVNMNSWNDNYFSSAQPNFSPAPSLHSLHEPLVQNPYLSPHITNLPDSP